MKVLFVFSANKFNSENPIVSAQGRSISEQNIEVVYFPIIGKGFRGYIGSIFKLRNTINRNRFDIIHAHYSLSGIVAGIAGCKPLLVSLMGSDVKAKFWYRFTIRFFNKLFWAGCIVKTEDMKRTLGLKSVFVQPNGVNLDIFKPIEKKIAQDKLVWNKSKKHILFASDPLRYEKNFGLVERAIKLINQEDIEVHFLKNIEHSKVSDFFNASDVVVLSSLWEGSPNSIKEAMACSRPIVSTNVGDVSWLFMNCDGHYIAEFDPQDFCEKVKEALLFSEQKHRTKGFQRIVELGLNEGVVASNIISIYEQFIRK